MLVLLVAHLQLSRDYLDANGMPFPDELGDVEKSMKVNANAKQDHVCTVNADGLRAFSGTQINEDMNIQGVRQNPKFDETESPHNLNGTGDHHIVLGSPTVFGKKRLRRKLLPTQDYIGDDEPEEVQVGSAVTKKSRKVSLTPVVNPWKVLMQQDVSERALSRFGLQSGCFLVKHGVESVKQIPSLKRDEEAASAPRNIGSILMRSCSPPVHASINIEGAILPPKEPSRISKYVIISDVESDAETQVFRRLAD